MLSSVESPFNPINKHTPSIGQVSANGEWHLLSLKFLQGDLQAVMLPVSTDMYGHHGTNTITKSGVCYDSRIT